MKAITILLLFISNSILCIANGGPLDESYLHKTGNIRLLTATDIQLESEKISVIVEGDFCYIRVKYLFENHSGKQDVRYGFPIDYYYVDSIDLEDDLLEKFDSGYRKDYVSNFKISDSNKEINAVDYSDGFQYDSKHWGVRNNKEKPTDYYSYFFKTKKKYPVSRKWYLSNLRFDSLEVKKVVVEYKVRTSYFDLGIGNSAYYSKRRFSYDLSPSKHWGDGIVKSFELDVKFTNQSILNDEHGLYGIDQISKTSKGYHLKIEDFDLNKYKIFHIIYNNYCYKESEWELNNIVIPILKNSSGNEVMAFDRDIKSHFYFDANEKDSCHFILEDMRFNRFGILNIHNIPVKLRISILTKHFAVQDEKWNSFIIDLKRANINLNDHPNNIHCLMERFIQGDWDGQFFLLKELKIEVLENEQGYEKIPIPEIMFTMF